MPDLLSQVIIVIGVGIFLLLPVGTVLRTGQWRRAGWVLMGVIGLPAALLTSAYYVGAIVLLLVFALGVTLARSKRLDHVLVAASAGLFGSGLLVIAVWSVSEGTFDWTLFMAGFLFCTSAVAAISSAAKLGRIAAKVRVRNPRLTRA
ncbi:MAG: hypothetical protein WEC75_11625 [Dehalococcoidia bacterium]